MRFAHFLQFHREIRYFLSIHGFLVRDHLNNDRAFHLTPDHHEPNRKYERQNLRLFWTPFHFATQNGSNFRNGRRRHANRTIGIILEGLRIGPAQFPPGTVRMLSAMLT
jgi:hypothetical protein